MLTNLDNIGMSRIGKKPIALPEGVTVNVADGFLIVKGPKGELNKKIVPGTLIEVKDATVFVGSSKEGKKSSALWGLSRSLIANAVLGVTSGFEKKLEIEGIGFRASLDGNGLTLLLGFSHPVRVEAPSGINFKVEKNVITISGIDKELVGQVAAKIRSLKKPEPYKGKGIRYQGEIIRRKVGKKATATAT